MSNPMGDRNLLVGILACQKHFISREVLAAALSAWTEAKEKGLTQILREQKALTENQHALLEEIVYDQLSKHGNDPIKALAAVASAGPIKEELAKIADADLQASLAHVAIARPEEPILAAMVEEAPKKQAAKPVKAAPKKPGPLPVPAKNPDARRDIPMWAWLGGGVIVGGFAILFAMMAVVVAVLMMRGDRIAPAKPEEAPLAHAKGEEQPAMKGPGIPEEPRVVEEPPLTDRKPTEIVGDAVWRVEGNELVVNNPTLKRAYLYFGNKAWSDYDFSFQTNAAARNGGPLALFRAADTENHYGFSLGAFVRTKHTLSRVEKGVLTYDVPEFAAPFKLDQWYAVRIEVRGDAIRCFVDGKQVFDYQNNAHARGQVALGATPEAQARWKNILVTSPDGKVLWDGPPDLAGSAGPPVEVEPQFILELPRPAGRACLSADGLRLAYTLPTPGEIGYREGPAFDVAKTAFIPGITTNVHPLASSPDGRKMAFTAGSREGPKVYLWDWASNSVEMIYDLTPFTNLAISSVFSPDGKYLATYLLQPQKNTPAQHWLELHEVKTGRLPSRWKLDAEPNVMGFTPDSRAILFAAKGDAQVRTWTFATARQGTIAFPPIAKQQFLARDFSRYAFLETPHQLQLGVLDGLRSLGKIETKNEVSHIFAAAFSADNRFVLIGTQETAPGAAPLPVWRGGTGRGMLYDVASGKPVSITEALDGVPDRVELASNGLGLLQSQKLRPRLYRFPIGGGELIVKKAPPVVPVAPGFVQLFNGKDLAGWKAAKFAQGNWRVENGILTAAADDKKWMRLSTEAIQPKDFHLRAEVRFTGKGFADVCVRSRTGDLHGYEATIHPTPAGGTLVGNLIMQVPGMARPLPTLRLATLPQGEWFTLEVLGKGNQLTVKANGKTTLDTTDQSTLTAGHVVLGVFGPSTLEFRKIEVQELAGNVVAAPPVIQPAEGFTALFNGKDLAGWDPHNRFPGQWRVENGILIGSAPNVGYLASKRDDFKDFHLRIETRFHGDGAGGDGSVLFRSTGDLLGFDTLINHPATRMTGNTMIRAKALRDTGISSVRADPGQWCMLEIIAAGDLVKVVVDGKPVGSFFDRNKEFTSGKIVLRHSARAKLEFRRVEIKEAGAVVVAPPPPPVFGQFVPLFNGRDLAGWKPHPKTPGDWRVVNGILSGNAAGGGFLITARDDYKDYHLRLEARLKPGGFSGVGFRYDIDHLGYVAQISEKQTGLMTVVTRFGDGNLRSQMNAGKATGELLPEWIPIDIIAEGNRVRILINGLTTADFTDTKNNFRSGHICLRDSRGSIEFRKIEIKELAAVAVAPLPKANDAPPFAAEEGFVSLFNGKDLTGWKSNGLQPGDWRVVNSVLTGVGPNLKMLYTPRDDYGDFHLRAEVRISADATGFVTFRYPYSPTEIAKQRAGGYGVRLNGNNGDLSKTGSIMVFEKVGTRHLVAKDALIQPGQWFNLEIIARGNQVTTKLNGQQAVSYLNPKTHLMGGRLVLQASSTFRPTVVEYRKIEIKEFKAVAAPPQPPPEGPLLDFVSILPGKDLAGWRVDKNGGIRVGETDDLIAQGRTGISTKRDTYRSLIAKVELSASADTEGFFAFRQSFEPPDGMIRGITSRITGDGVSLVAGHVGTDGAKAESGNQPIQFKPGEWVAFEFHVRQDGVKVFANGRQTASILYAPDRHPPGAVGLFVQKGAMRVRKFEISAEAPIGAPGEVAPPPVAAGEFTPLFNGKDLAGWQADAQLKADWRVENGVLIGPGNDAGVLHTVRRDYKDFHVRMEARFTAGPEAGSSGILFRSPAGRSGVEAVFAKGKFTGALYLSGEDFGKPVPAKEPANVASGEWFNLDFLAQGNRLTVKVNGKETTNFIDEENLFKEGRIGLRQSVGVKVEFRKIEIKELQGVVAAPPVELPGVKDGFTALFNGKDLAGWQPHAKRPGNWRVENGILIGSAPIGGSLYSTRGDYQDFHLRAEVKINDKGFGRIFGRAAYDPTRIPFKVNGYEVLINQRPLGDKTGTLTASGPLGTSVTQAKEAAAPADGWHLVEVVAKGDLVSVKVNGAAVAEFRDEKRQFAKSGHIALHQDANAAIEFRKVEIEDFTNKKAGAAGGRGGFLVSLPASNLAQWRIEGNELIQDSTKAYQLIYFGDAGWTDYDFSVDAMRTAGTDQFGLWFRRQPNDGYLFGVGARQGTTHMIARLKGGAIDHQSPLLDAKDKQIENDRWYNAKISVRGDKGQCFLDGVQLFEFKADQIKAGSVGLRTWSSGYKFKNIKVSAPDGTVLLEGLPDFDLKPPPLPPIELPKGGMFVPLYPGKLVDWKVAVNQKGVWTTSKDGVLTGGGDKASRIHSPRDDYKDFHLRLEARVSDKGAGGVFVRAPLSTFKGYEAKINCSHSAPNKTGSLEAHVPGKAINLVTVKESPVDSDEWFTLEIIAIGNRLTVLVNGKTTADTIDVDPAYPSGHICLYYTANSKIEFRKIEIKEFPAP